jgi:hypothetical protein
MLRFLRSGLRGSSVGHYKKKQAWSHLWEGADLEDPAKLKKVVLLQSAWRRQLARRLRKKLLIANELLKTEENYVRALSIVCNSFYYPLLMLEERKSPLLDKKDVEAIFSVAGKLYEGQQLFLGALRARIMDLRGFDRHSVGDIFLEQTAFFDLYTTYINNYDTSIGTLKRCKKDNPNFTKFISKVRSSSKTFSFRSARFTVGLATRKTNSEHSPFAVAFAFVSLAFSVRRMKNASIRICPPSSFRFAFINLLFLLFTICFAY